MSKDSWEELDKILDADRKRTSEAAAAKNTAADAAKQSRDECVKALAADYRTVVDGFAEHLRERAVGAQVEATETTLALRFWRRPDYANPPLATLQFMCNGRHVVAQQDFNHPLKGMVHEGPTAPVAVTAAGADAFITAFIKKALSMP